MSSSRVERIIFLDEGFFFVGRRSFVTVVMDVRAFA